MPLSEADFTALVDAGCDTCGGKTVLVESIVLQKIPLLGGEPYGAPSWGYKGEDLVRGTYRIACKECERDLYASSVCPRCESEGGIARALENENAFALPEKCQSCGNEMLTANAYVPAVVVYEGKRAAKARTTTKPEDPGFHASRVECKECHTVLQRKDPCPICG
jgi:RNA polymerase subunit RPABC4/transcription elongation factor Spt4